MIQKALQFFVLLPTALMMQSSIWAQKPEDSLALIADLSTQKELRRSALSTQLGDMGGEKDQILMSLFWRPGVLQSFLEPRSAAKSNSLEARLLAKPEFIRFLGAAFSHPDVGMRQCAIAWSQHSTWPWLLRRRLRAYRSETHNLTRERFLDAIQGALKSEEMETVLVDRRGLEAEKGALFRLGLARAPKSQRVQAWPGARDWHERGFSNSQDAAPYRLIAGTQARIPGPFAQKAETLLIGIRRISAKKRGLMRVRLGSQSLGEFAIGTSAQLKEIIEINFAVPTSLFDQDVILDFDDALKGQIQFRAVVALEASSPEDFFIASEVVMGNTQVEASHGLALAKSKTAGVTLTGKEAHIAVIIPKYQGRARRVDLDHWSPSVTPSVWDVSLNGQPLVRLISQRLPRAAKCFPTRAKLAPGRNELIFTRISGGELNLEAIRFVR